MTTQLLISPTEPQWLKSLGKSSATCEKYGSDILLLPYRAGVQRKEFGDLLNSLTDGRLAKEMQQITRLPYGVLIVEGRPRWTADGVLVSAHHRFTKAQYHGLLLSVQLRGVWVLQTREPEDTLTAVNELVRWFEKSNHSSLDRRPKERSVWGKPTAKDYAAHVLQALPSCGPTRAMAIVTKFGMPLRWTITAEELATVEGVGPRTATALIGALNSE